MRGHRHRRDARKGSIPRQRHAHRLGTERRELVGHVPPTVAWNRLGGERPRDPEQVRGSRVLLGDELGDGVPDQLRTQVLDPLELRRQQGAVRHDLPVIQGERDLPFLRHRDQQAQSGLLIRNVLGLVQE